MLKIIDHPNEYKKQFSKKWQKTLSVNKEFSVFLDEIFIHGTAYIIGGYLRDVSLNQNSRDLDIILTTPFNEIISHLKSNSLNFTINRLSGIKIKLNDIDVDIWGVENNWAFENKVVVQNDDYLLNSIANGCFYNYDSLVMNLDTAKFNFKHYNNFIKHKTLDIIQKTDVYKLRNPTIEANILRAFYLRNLYNINYTSNCNNYLLSRIGFLKDNYKSYINRLLDYKKKYIKYDKILTEKNIFESIEFCYNSSSQIKLKM